MLHQNSFSSWHHIKTIQSLLLILLDIYSYQREKAKLWYVDVSGTNQALAWVALTHESIYLLEWLHLSTAQAKFQLDPSVYRNASA